MIYDCFIFFNELDVLEIRLHTLADVVDRFVLVEARQTHQRGEKPLYYADNRDRFSSFADRIEHVIVDEFPEQATTAADCEHWQRQAIRLGLSDVQEGDTVLISDVDEIPRPDAVLAAVERGGVNIFRQSAFYYFLNFMLLRLDGTEGPVWSGTVAYRHDRQAETPQDYSALRWLRGWKGDRVEFRLRTVARRALRRRELQARAHFLDDAGWHFTYLGGVDSIIAKLEAFCHTEYNTEAFKDPRLIEAALQEGKDVLGGPAQYRRVPVDGRFPTWLQEMASLRYSHLLAPER